MGRESFPPLRKSSWRGMGVPDAQRRPEEGDCQP